MVDYLLLVWNAAFNSAVDLTQLIVFLLIVLLEGLAMVGLSRAMVDKLSTRFTSGKALLIVFVAVIATRLLMAPYWVWKEEKIAHLNSERELATITGERNSLQDFINRKNDRTVLHSYLNKFYVEGSFLEGGASLTDYAEYRKLTAEWRGRVVKFLRENMTEGAAARFQETSEYYRDAIHYPSISDANFNWEMNEMAWRRRNLEKLMNTDIWDKPR